MLGIFVQPALNTWLGLLQLGYVIRLMASLLGTAAISNGVCFISIH